MPWALMDTLMFDHGVIDKLLQRSNNKTLLGFWSHPSKWHCLCPRERWSLTVKRWSPSLEPLSLPLPVPLRRLGTLHCCSTHNPKNEWETYPSSEGTGRLGSYKQSHTSSPPLTKGNAKVQESPANLKKTDCEWRWAQLSLAGTAQPPIPTQAFSPPVRWLFMSPWP